MSDIKSDLGGASKKATALKSATETLLRKAAVTNDTQTTVAGNTDAQTAIQLAQNSVQKIAEAVSFASSNLQSVAENFEALDQKVGQTLAQSIGGLNS